MLGPAGDVASPIWGGGIKWGERMASDKQIANRFLIVQRNERMTDGTCKEESIQ